MKGTKRQIKREKIVDALTQANYSVQNWIIDLQTNSCPYFVIRNNINNLDLLCSVPSNILLVADSGSYITKIEPTPDYALAISIWNECPVESFAIFVNGGVIIKKAAKEFDSFILTKEKPIKSDVELIAYSEAHSYNDDVVEVVDNQESFAEIITDEINPFDILLDGGDVKIESAKRVEDCQPSFLINYKGFTYGQALPIINIIEFMNQKKGYEVILSKKTNELLTWQALKMQTSAEEALQLLKKFEEALQKSCEDWKTEWATKSEMLNRIQSILEKSHSKQINDTSTRAGIALKETIEELISRRDNLLGLLIHVKSIFNQI